MEYGGLRNLLSALLCVYHTLLLECPLVSALSFHTQPVSVVQIQNGSVHLHCVVVPTSASVTWLFQGQVLEPGEPTGVQIQMGTLFLPSLQPQNTGTYQCVARSDTGAIASRLATLAIADIEEFKEKQRRSLVVNRGDNAVIECPLPRSLPPALPRYKIRGKWLEESTDEYLILPSGNLQIVSVSAEHQGVYRCGAYNPVSREVRVQAHGTKLIVKGSDSPSPVGIVYPVHPVGLTVERSMSVVLECVVSGSPVVRWMKEGRELSFVPRRLRLLHTNLLLSDAQLSDAGNYTCSIQTEGGATASASYTVHVLKAPSVMRELSDQTVALGSSVKFTCDTRGTPVPKITWLFNAAAVLPSPRLHISDSALVISSVTGQDQGMYQCLVENTIGSAESAARLIVESEPRFGSSPPAADALASLPPVQSDEGDEHSLLLEEELGDGVGPFAKGSSDQPTPEAPIIISPPQTQKPNTYNLEWRPGRDWGSPIKAFFVKYRKVDDMGTVVGSWHTVRVPGSEKSLPLSDLEPSSLYEVLMVARSTAGEGQPAMLTFRTGKERSSTTNKSPPKPPVVPLPEKPPEDKDVNRHYGVVMHDRVPEAPDRPTVSTVSETSVSVQWIPRANGGFPITAFRLEYRKQGRSGDWIIAADNISPLKLSVEVQNLEPGATYRFRVIAMNTYGESPHSATSKPYQVAMTNQATSNRPVTGPHISSTDAVSDTQIMVRWTYTPSSNNNTPIQGFYIYYRPTDSDNDGDYKKDVVEGMKRWHMIGQLQPETSYDIKMQCFNDAGKSDYSNVMICETRARQAPGVPSQRPITPPGGHVPSGPASGSGVLYLIVGCVLGFMVLVLLIFIVICLLRNRQQHSLQKHTHPGYLFQPADMNGYMMDYSALPASGQRNGSVHTGMLPHNCHHHHKHGNGLALLNGSGPVYTPGQSRAHNPPLTCDSMDKDFTHTHHMHKVENMYTSVSSKDFSNCSNCQNFCNNNRCYMKANGAYSGSALPLMRHLLPCQLDSIEMVPLNRGSPRCHGERGNRQQEVVIGEEPQDDSASASSHRSPSIAEEVEPNPDPERGKVQRISSDSLLCLERLDLSDLDCKDKVWISTSSLNGDLYHHTAQET